MDSPRLSSSVRRVTVLRKEGSGTAIAVTVYKKVRKRKKGVKSLRPLERATRRLVKAQERTAERYLRGHNKSNRKRKDGWIRDYVVNTARANNKGAKALKMRRLLNP